MYPLKKECWIMDVAYFAFRWYNDACMLYLIRGLSCVCVRGMDKAYIHVFSEKEFEWVEVSFNVWLGWGWSQDHESYVRDKNHPGCEKSYVRSTLFHYVYYESKPQIQTRQFKNRRKMRSIEVRGITWSMIIKCNEQVIMNANSQIKMHEPIWYK